MKVVELFKRASLKVLVDCWADYVSADDANQGNKARLINFYLFYKKSTISISLILIESNFVI